MKGHNAFKLLAMRSELKTAKRRYTITNKNNLKTKQIKRSCAAIM